MFITLPDATLYSTAFGTNGRSLLALGGWIGSWELWAEPFSILSQSWQTISYDHRGSGATLAPVTSITFDQLVQDVFTVLDIYGVEQCVLAAESAGAAIAITAVLQHPHRFSGLIIIDGLYYRPAPMATDSFLQNLQTNYSLTLDWFAQACAPRPEDAAVRYWGRKILDRASQESALALYQIMESLDLREQLRKLTLPTLVIHGRQDTILPVQNSQNLAALLPNARLIIIEGASHVPTLTHPQEVAQAIMDFF